MCCNDFFENFVQTALRIYIIINNIMEISLYFARVTKSSILIIYSNVYKNYLTIIINCCC